MRPAAASPVSQSGHSSLAGEAVGQSFLPSLKAVILSLSACLLSVTALALVDSGVTGYAQRLEVVPRIAEAFHLYQCVSRFDGGLMVAVDSRAHISLSLAPFA